MLRTVPLGWLALAGLAPAGWIVAVVTGQGLDRDWIGASLLAATSLALGAGVIVACMLARGVTRAVGELAFEAGLVTRGSAVARLERAVGEFSAVADALQTAAERATAETRGPAAA